MEETSLWGSSGCSRMSAYMVGVPEKWVIHDYGLSNRYNAEQVIKIQKSLRKVGVDPDKLMDYMTAPKSAIVAVIEHINKKYGSVRGYLTQKAKIPETWIDTLEEDMLE